MKRWVVGVCWFGIGLSVAAHAAAAQFTVEDFALRVDVSAPTQSTAAPFLRVSVPAQVWRHTRSAELADLRVFNSAGETLPFALTRPQTERPVEADVAVPVYPIYESEHRAALAGGHLQIRQSAGVTTVVVEGASASPQNQKQGKKVAAYFMDTRQIKSWVSALQIDAALEAGRLVPITVEASADLKSWRTLAQREPVFRLESEAQGEATQTLTRVAFRAATSLEDQYLRLTWADAGALEVKGVTLKTLSAAHELPAPDTELALGAPTAREHRQGADELEWTLPTPARIARISLRLEQINTLIPVTVHGRRRAGEPWVVVGRGVVYRLNQEGVEHTAQPLLITAGTYQALRLVAANPSGGWGDSSANLAPHLTLHFEPREVVFLARSPRPADSYTLAVGHPEALSAALPIQTLLPAYQPKGEFALPQARIGASSVNATLAAPPRVGPGGIELRTWILWGVLISAVLVLAYFAYSLMRRVKSTEKNEGA